MGFSRWSALIQGQYHTSRRLPCPAGRRTIPAGEAIMGIGTAVVTCHCVHSLQECLIHQFVTLGLSAICILVNQLGDVARR
jgi:hypothetical protein